MLECLESEWVLLTKYVYTYQEMGSKDDTDNINMTKAATTHIAYLFVIFL